MEWWEKEAAFEERYSRGQVTDDLWKYIPEKLMDAVCDTAVDQDGYWVYLEEGWTMDGDNTIHTHTIADLRADIRRIRRK